MHKLLDRQLRRIGLYPDTPPVDTDSWKSLLDRVGRTYVETDQGRYLLGRSLAVHRGEVVLEDAGWGCPAECSVGSVVIVEMHEPGVGAGPLGF